MKKLRQLFDRFYVWVESTVNAVKDYRIDRRCARAMPANPQVERQYPTVIRPYWRQFRVRTPRKFWFTLFANAHKPFSPKYIPNDLWFSRIVPHYSDTILAKAWQDKCAYNLLFADMRQPKTVVKNMAGLFCDDALAPMTEEQAVARCRGRGQVIVKPSIGSGGGRGIRFFDMDRLSDGEIRDVFRLYGKNFIIQEKLVQHPDLERINPGSLNTLRVITFLHEGQVHILGATLRMGGPGSELDNISQGGYQCAVRPDGRLHEMGMTRAGGRWQYAPVHPGGIPFADMTVPSFSAVVDTVRTHAARMPHFRIIGWDIAVDPEGAPVLIEFNALPGQMQGTNGPIFGDLTDQVLEEVFGRRGKP